MSVKSSAKPIIRRRRVDSTRRPNVPVLFSVPDLRPAATKPEEDSVLEDATPQEQFAVVSNVLDRSDSELSIDDIESPALTDELDSVEPAVSLVDPSEPRTEFGIAPPRNVIGSTVANEVGRLDDIEDMSSPVAPVNAPPAEGRNRSRQKRSKRPETPAVDAPKTTLEVEMFSKKIQKNLSTLGTIAAAILVCTVVARAMKDDNQPRDSELAATPSELIDQVEKANPQVEVVAEVTPQFDPADLQRSVQSNPFNRPLNSVVQQQQDPQVSTAARFADAPESQGKVDPFALPGFGGGQVAQPVQNTQAAFGQPQPVQTQPAQFQPGQFQPTQRQPTGPTFAAPQNSGQQLNLSSSASVGYQNNPAVRSGVVQANGVTQQQSPSLPPVPNRFGQAPATGYPATSQGYQAYNQMNAAPQQPNQTSNGQLRVGNAGDSRYSDGTANPVFNNNGGVIR